MRPIQVPTNAPAIPSRIVTMQPPGSFPGISNFAIAPTTRPTRIVQMIECALKSIMKRSCIELNRARQGNWFGLKPLILQPRTRGACLSANSREITSKLRSRRGVWGACAPQKIRLQLNHLRRVNVLARANFAQQLFAWGGVEIQHCKRGTAGLISA